MVDFFLNQIYRVKMTPPKPLKADESGKAGCGAHLKKHRADTVYFLAHLQTIKRSESMKTLEFERIRKSHSK